MTGSISFPSVSAVHSLPLVFPGQAQKEISINHALALVDLLLQRCVDGSADTPPADAAEGTVYRVGTSPIGEWADQADRLAILLGGAWHFIDAFRGLSIFDRQIGKQLFFDTSWQCAPQTDAPDGGTTVDLQARESINQLIESLTSLGFLSATTNV